MKSLCIKTNNTKIINYLLKELEEFNLNNVHYSCRKFALFNNVIIHYTGENTELFFTKLSTLLSYLIIDNFETSILKRILYTEYFYFNTIDINQILNICNELIENNDEFDFENRQLILFDCFYNYLSKNKKLFLNGFINFRMKNYISFLEHIVDTAVNKFIVEKEYTEFISLLKYYISSQYSKINCVHLVHSYDKFILFDNNKNLINLEEYTINNKYLSDISFSSNDYILNALLELVPDKIIVHIENNYEDEFLNTLKLIFEGRISLCNDYSILSNY